MRGTAGTGWGSGRLGPGLGLSLEDKRGGEGSRAGLSLFLKAAALGATEQADPNSLRSSGASFPAQALLPALLAWGTSSVSGRPWDL